MICRIQTVHWVFVTITSFEPKWLASEFKIAISTAQKLVRFHESLCGSDRHNLTLSQNGLIAAEQGELTHLAHDLFRKRDYE
jgi:hypothetical protein